MDEGLLSQATRLGPVHLKVTDIPSALSVWRDTLGLALAGEDAAQAELGAGGRTLIVLHAGAEVALPQKSRDLFHVAIHVTTRRDLAHTAARLKASGLRYSAQDHLISESLYVSDPSGNGIEICFDTPERLLRREVSPSGRVSLIAVDGSAHSGLEPLNMSGLLRDLGNSGHVEPRMAQDAFIGHIHLRARAPEMLMKFYLGVLGFRPHIQSRSFGMFDCGTERRPHMVAFNIWARDELREPPPGAAGLDHFTIELGSAQELGAVQRRLEAADIQAKRDGRAISTADPEGNRLRLVVQGG
ncbi:MAG: catechol 1,2-dioxygenase [Mesorhizobium sp.]|nr:VOC family protein [Mesorhizobium sp.]RWH67663.1 MAG: catechol 1,2-dioxygenase [Mesorhizobium sp.]RWL23422.1 MAG: catechol 1,2-dioxygenase [Mesorhizobium sp.]RWL25233.1 MAG: catechol 1,2-dioxygenase [Mesorhizobium sp.]RWL33239.1 MAG: catechol 1,2-dioxygenase [Mesorhizobium sp.]RWL46290.1 MAG: catechol 1,2-dioxygenase [Mesorhizobium sp.]